MGNINEAGVIFHNTGGHDHDGVNSTKVNFENYTEEDLAPIFDKITFPDPPSTQTGGTTTTTSTGKNNSVIFHQGGTVALSPSIVAKKLIWYPTSSIRVISTLGAAGTSPTTITIYKNGNTVAATTLTANNTFKDESFNVTFDGVIDQISARVTVAGTGAQELAVEIIAIPTSA